MILSPSRVGIIVGLSNLRSMYGVDFLGIHTLLLFALIIILCVVSAIASEPSSAFPFVTLRQVLCEALATLNFECKPGWPCTYRDLAASLSQVPGLFSFFPQRKHSSFWHVRITIVSLFYFGTFIM